MLLGLLRNYNELSIFTSRNNSNNKLEDCPFLLLHINCSIITLLSVAVCAFMLVCESFLLSCHTRTQTHTHNAVQHSMNYIVMFMFERRRIRKLAVTNMKHILMNFTNFGFCGCSFHYKHTHTHNTHIHMQKFGDN